MQTLTAALIAAFLGIAVGYWLSSTSAKAEKTSQDQRIRALETESDARAGYESVALDRQKSLERASAEWAEERKGLRAELNAKSDSERIHSALISQLETDLKNERQSAQEKLKLLTDARTELTNQFKTLAGEILEEKSTKFTEQNKLNLDHLLGPLRLQINDFRGKVEEAQKENLVGRTELTGELRQLKALNDRLSTEAHNLSSALRGSTSVQGGWGEDIAHDLLELGGLREGVQYRLQQTFDAHAEEDAGRRSRPRPDIVVTLPGGRNLVVDSKVSLNAYTDYVKAEVEGERDSALKRHLSDLRKHIKELSERKYHKLLALESPDFVVMFVPIEPAFLAAIHDDPTLWRYAYEKNILLVGPTTLLFVIRIVDNLWKQELQAKSVEKVIDRGEKLYEKFVGFVTDLSKVGDGLRDAQKHFDGAWNKLTDGRENLVRQTEMLKEFGIHTKKQLPTKLLDAAGLNEDEQATLALAASGDSDSQES